MVPLKATEALPIFTIGKHPQDLYVSLFDCRAFTFKTSTYCSYFTSAVGNSTDFLFSRRG